MAVSNKPISRSPVTTLGQGIDPARRLLRGGRTLNMGFVRFVKPTPSNLVKGTSLPDGVPANTRGMVAGATYPTIAVRRIFGGNVASQRRATHSGRVQSSSGKQSGFNSPVGSNTGATTVYGSNNANRRSSVTLPTGGRAVGRSQRRR